MPAAIFRRYHRSHRKQIRPAALQVMDLFSFYPARNRDEVSGQFSGVYGEVPIASLTSYYRDTALFQCLPDLSPEMKDMSPRLERGRDILFRDRYREYVSLLSFWLHRYRYQFLIGEHG